MKSTIRKEMIQKRNSIKNREERSSKICELIQKNEMFQKSKKIGLYKSIFSEVDTKEMIEYSYLCGKQVCFPCVEGEDIVFYEMKKEDLFEIGSYGIEEPSPHSHERMIPEFVVVPGVAFDQQGGRMGYGKGYYDRFFEKVKAYKVGICFLEQLMDKVPMNEKDIYMDLVIHD